MELIESPAYFIGKGGGELISFGSGQPDLPPPECVYDVVQSNKEFRYGLVQGQEPLRTELAKRYVGANPEQFVITNGASEALTLTIHYIGATATKKKFLLPRPYYYSYPFLVQLAGLEVEYYDLIDGKINWPRFAEQCKQCCGVLINSPGNPTGTVQDVAVLQQVEAAALEHGFFIVSDEVYSDIIYARPNYIMQGPTVIVINSFSKTYGMCGYRVGYLYSHDPLLIKAVVQHKNYSSMNTNLLAQAMACSALAVHDEYVKQCIDIWAQRCELIYQGMTALGLSLWKPEGAFYVLPKFPERYGSANEIINDLYWQYKLIAYDGAWFGAPNRVRFSYALDANKIEEGLRRLKQYLDNK